LRRFVLFVKENATERNGIKTKKPEDSSGFFVLDRIKREN
jgi:hypothetical protein